MPQHEYSSFSDGNVDKALRTLEAREREGWELVTLLPRPQAMFFGSGIASAGVVIVVRRPAATTHARP